MRVPRWLALYLIALEAERQGLDDLAEEFMVGSILEAVRRGWLDNCIEKDQGQHMTGTAPA